MKTRDPDDDNPTGEPDQEYSRSPWLRFFAIPLLVYLAWVVEMYLLWGRAGLAESPGSAGILLYTIVSCILIGIVVPILLVRRSFASGAVNMHHVGFRPAWRTGPIVLGTLAVILPVTLIFSPFGADRVSLGWAFLLVLPTAIASVMICQVLAGTHVQAFMRSAGVLASISVGVIVTAFLFAFASIARVPGPQIQDSLIPAICAGAFIAFFFFALRDIYATILVTASCLILTRTGNAGSAVPAGSVAAIAAGAFLCVLALALVHIYFTTAYTTILVRKT